MALGVIRRSLALPAPLCTKLGGRRPTLSLSPMTSSRYASTGGTLNTYLVTPQELSQALAKNAPTKISTSPRIIPLSAAWFLPNDPEGRTGQKAFEQKRIPSARFFDIDDVRDRDSQYPHMLPTAEGFAEAMAKLGIRRDDQVVVYDTHELGIFSAPRVAWTLRVFGHPGVHILNNFRLWVDQGFPTENGAAPEPEPTKYPLPKFSNPEMVACYREMKSIARDYGKEGADSVQIADARSPGRFAGTEPEPRPGLSSGHMPGSFNVPLPEILDATTKALLPAEELRRVFEAKGLDPKQPIYSTCGSGVMAAALEAAFNEAGFGEEKNRKVYDGSWTWVHSLLSVLETTLMGKIGNMRSGRRRRTTLLGSMSKHVLILRDLDPVFMKTCSICDLRHAKGKLGGFVSLPANAMETHEAVESRLSKRPSRARG